MTAPERAADHIVLREPELVFSATQPAYRCQNPMQGLLNWGPYDASLGGYVRPNPVRLALLTTSEGFPRIAEHLQRVRQGASHNASHEYIRPYPGFSQVYRTNLEFPASPNSPLVIILPSQEIDWARDASSPHQAFFDLVVRSMAAIHGKRHEFDVLVFHVPDELSMFREYRMGEMSFNLHDAVKSHLSRLNVKVQFIEDHSLAGQMGAEVAWWLSLALYAKANGIPWKLAAAPRETAYVGLAYAIKAGETQQRIVMGCSQVFDEHGEGLRFILYELERAFWHKVPSLGYKYNPFMSREDARALFWRVRDLYQRSVGHRPRRVVVHKSVFFTEQEIDGIREALTGVEDVELLQIDQTTELRGISYACTSRAREARPVVQRFPLLRGTALPLDGCSFALWTQGDVPGDWGGGRRHYYPEKRSIPSPLIVRRFLGSSALEEVATELLQLTKMDWNTLGLYSRLPVTITYSQRIARIAKEIPEVAASGLDIRFVM